MSDPNTELGLDRPLLEAEKSAQPGNASDTEHEHSYTEFYARLGTHEDELALGGQSTQLGLGAAASSRSSVSSSQDHDSVGLIGDRESLAETVGESRRTRFTNGFNRRPNLTTACTIATTLLLMIALLWWVSGGSKNVGPPNWKPSKAYEVGFVITLATGLEEPGVAMVDSQQGAMRVSYYSGMATYIFNETGRSWSVVPNIDRLQCFESSKGSRLQAVFPDLKRFKYVRQRDIPIKSRTGSDVSKLAKNGKLACAEWIYRSTTASDDGYQGTYTLWTRPGSNNIPIRFSFIGRSIILGASHFDNFTIDYFNYRDLITMTEGGVDPFWLKPPKGMPCEVTTKATSESIGDGAGLGLLLPFEETHEADPLYAEFVSTHSQKGASDARRMLFYKTLRHVEAHNRDATKTYQLGVNKFADWTEEERADFVRESMRRTHWSDLPNSTCEIQTMAELLGEYSAVQLPKEIDYVNNGLVRPAEEQGSCGASWAYAVTGCVEAQIAKKLQKPPVALSSQNLIDCSERLKPFKGLTCEVGLDYLGYDWIIKNKGQVATEATYPRLDQFGFCHFDLTKNLVSDGAKAETDAPKVTRCIQITDAFSKFNSSHLMSADDLVKVFNLRLHTEGPLVVNIDLSDHDLFFYKNGIYNTEKCTSDAQDLDHAMLAVGFELDGPTPFTRLRNTFGVGWGEGGYVRIAQNRNMCGVATAASFVKVE